MTVARLYEPTRRTGFDLWLVVAPLLAAGLGTVMVYTATRTASGVYYAERQAGFCVIGIIVMAIFSILDYHRLEQVATAAYVAILLGLVAVMGMGSSALGASRWISLGPIQVQPSEFAILGLILAVATYCARRPDGLGWRDLSRILLMAGAPMGLVFLQPDFGTAIIMAVVLLVLLIAAGVPLRIVGLLLLAAVLAVVAAVEFGVLKQYQVLRFTAFLHQNSADPSIQQYIYNVQQSKDAIGTGGLFGTGIGRGTVTNLQYVPEQQTDFIFSAIGEQLGFVGSVAMLALLGSIAWRVLVTAVNARDVLGRLLAAGIFAFFAFSIFQNAGMATGIMPVAGIPLPFVSYGGSAIVCFFAACGVANSIARRRGV